MTIAELIKSQGPSPGAQSGAQSTAILRVLSDAPLPAAEIATTLGLDTKTGALKRTLKELLLQELIVYTLPEKPTSRLQKYSLTEKGKTGSGGRDMKNRETGSFATFAAIHSPFLRIKHLTAAAVRDVWQRN